MTVRNPQQRRILEELVHMRVAPEDAWLTTQRLAQLTGRTPDRTRQTLKRLELRGQVENAGGTEPDLWRATAAGREAIQ